MNNIKDFNFYKSMVNNSRNLPVGQHKTNYPTLDNNIRIHVLNQGLNDNLISWSKNITNEFNKTQREDSKRIQVKRSSYIISARIGNEFEVHNGRQYVRIKIKSEMVGHRFGEFVTTMTKYKGLDKTNSSTG